MALNISLPFYSTKVNDKQNNEMDGGLDSFVLTAETIYGGMEILRPK